MTCSALNTHAARPLAETFHSTLLVNPLRLAEPRAKKVAQPGEDSDTAQCKDPLRNTEHPAAGFCGSPHFYAPTAFKRMRAPSLQAGPTEADQMHAAGVGDYALVFGAGKIAVGDRHVGDPNRV